MANFREKFKATKIKDLKKAVDKDDAMVGVSNNDYLNLEDGKTLKIRIFPAHPGHEQFYVPKKCYWLSFPAEDGGDNKRGTVLDSIVHGGTKMDLVQEYVKYAKKKYGDDDDKMETLTGTGMNSNALNPQYSWLCYASIVTPDEELHPKVWEFKKMVRDALNKLAFDEDNDEPIEVDPFTDPDDGLVLAVKYLKKPNKKKGENYYEVDFAKTGKKKEAYSRAITDDELEAFSRLKPLNEVVPRYTKKEFDRALEGLQCWDEEFDFNLFDDDEWLEIVEAVKEQYNGSSDDDDEDEKPKKKTVKKTSKKVEEEEDADDEEEKKPAKKSAKKKVEEEPEDSEDEDSEEEETDDEDDSEEEETDSDEFDDMDRKELKHYIKENELEITVKKSMSDDDIRDLIREAVADSDDEDDSEEEENDEDSDDEEEQPKSKVSLDDIRKKLAGKK